jgi:hypothetical protein
MKGRSSHSSCLKASTCCGVASSPRAAAAGSPGMMYNNKKDKKEIMIRTRIVSRSLLIIKLAKLPPLILDYSRIFFGVENYLNIITDNFSKQEAKCGVSWVDTGFF